ncbi:zinc-binding dehydrogenase family oxidoreductase [Hyaloraphidium curvatum]|nr:zinc-binding dehydrogenase family oxidoreductase [Hyaloraphidium curvatum]
MSKNRQIMLVARPEPGPLQPEKLFQLRETEVPKAAKPGDVVVRNLYLSLDPTMRGWMTYDTYVPAVPLNSVMRGGTVSRVVESKSEKFKAGDLVRGMSGWQEYALVNEKEIGRLNLPEGISPADQISLQLTGLTAMVGIYKVGLAADGKLKPGSTVLVSGAAGSTGSFAGQIYRDLGCRVIGTAGGPEKCKLAEEVFKFDKCVDYKAPNFRKNLKAACPDGIVEYFDNVGGETLEIALDLLKLNGRIVLCGGISIYGDAKPAGPSNYLNIVGKNLRMEGYVFTTYASEFPWMMKKMVEMKRAGKLVILNDEREGLENAGRALKDVFEGRNKGKMMVKL